MVIVHQTAEVEHIRVISLAVQTVQNRDKPASQAGKHNITDMDKTTHYAELLTTTENSNRGVSGMLKSETPLFCAGYSMKAKGPIRPMPYSLLTIGLFYPIIKLRV